MTTRKLSNRKASDDGHTYLVDVYSVATGKRLDMLSGWLVEDEARRFVSTLNTRRHRCETHPELPKEEVTP